MTEINIEKIVRSKRRTIGLEVTQDAKLVVRAPFHVSVEDIQNILLKKRNWILEKQIFLQQHKDLYSPKKFVNGESFYYLGIPYRLKLVDGDAIRLTEYLEFPKNLLSNAQKQLMQWYKNRAYEKIKERVDRYSKIIGLSYSLVKISNAKKRLGSCSLTGNLNFSWRLIMSSLEIIDYVVVHELVHLEEKNHSSSFWNKVSVILPDYKKRKTLLKKRETIAEVLTGFLEDYID